MTSESNEMLIVFKSNYSHDILADQRGFHAIVSIGSLKSAAVFISSNSNIMLFSRTALSFVKFHNNFTMPNKVLEN